MPQARVAHDYFPSYSFPFFSSYSSFLVVCPTMGWWDYLPNSSKPTLKSTSTKRRTPCSVQNRSRTACSVPRPALCYFNRNSLGAGSGHCLRTMENLCRLGSAQEPDFAHAQRHPVAELNKWARTCQRCLFIKWTKQQTSLGEAVPNWLVAKPSYLKGTWGLGCIVCAAGKQSLLLQEVRRQHMATNKFAGRCKQAISRCSKFASYESRGFRNLKELSAHVKQHSASDMHRLCSSNSMQFAMRHPSHSIAGSRWAVDSSNSRAMAGPLVAPSKQIGATTMNFKRDANFDSKPSTIVIETVQSKVGSVDDPFRGRVPQCKDWLNVWAEYTSTLSGRKQVALAEKKVENSKLSRCTRTRMLAIMARAMLRG